MSAIDVALRRINMIPKDVLKQAFMPARYDPTRLARYYDNSIALSLDACITDQVIRGRVMMDIDLISGTMDHLRLDQAEAQFIDPYNTIYRFTEEQTVGRTITSTYEVTYGYGNNTLSGSYNGYGISTARTSMLLKSARDILTASGGVSPRSTSYLQIVGHNTVLVNDVSPIQSYGVLRCMLTNDPNLNNIRTQYHQVFATMCFLACKAYIYTKLLIDIDEGMLRGGQQIGRFREVVDSYSDADQMYIETLDKWQKIGIMNDPSLNRIVGRLALGIRPKL